MTAIAPPPSGSPLDPELLQLRALLDAAAACVVLVGPDGRLARVNLAVEHLTGRRAESLRGRPFWEVLVAPDAAIEAERALRAVWDGSGAATVELPFSTVEGARRMLLWSFGTAGGGTAPGIVGTALDVTERRAAALAAREADERFRVVTEGAPLGVLLVRDGRLLYANGAARGLLGVGAGADVASLELVSRIAPAHRDDAARLVAEAAAHQVVSLPRELALLRADGGTTPVLVQVGHVDLPDGPALVAFLSDLTSRKALEAELQQAQKMEAIGRLAGGIAHDFNNVLTAVLSYCELLLADLAPGHPNRGDVEQIALAGERAAGLTRQLLAFSRRQVLQPRPISLAEVVRQAEGMLRPLLGAHLELRLAVAPRVATIVADPGQMQQVVLNLALNARDAMPRGGLLEIAVGDRLLEATDPARPAGAAPGRYVELTVRDTGTGMDAETLAHVFEPFFTTKGPGRGTGLGLSTVHGIVEQSGGHLGVESEPGRGTTFRVCFPAVDGAPEADPPRDPQDPVRGDDETILLVEDDAIVRRLAREVLTRAGYRVLEAADGGEALRLCERHDGPIDLMICDVIMPRMTGPQLVERLPWKRAATRVLYVSGYAEDAIRWHGALSPGTELLPKPFTPETLTRKVRELLVRGRG